VSVLGNWALVANGTFFGAMSIRTRSREVMLPLLLFPISIPAILAMVSSTAATLTGEGSAHLPLVFLAVYDLVFTVLGVSLFQTVLQAE
jgi:heme exporter protein B